MKLRPKKNQEICNRTVYFCFWLVVVGMREQCWDLADRHSSIIVFPNTPHVCGWTAVKASASISGEGAAELWPMDTRPGWSSTSMAAPPPPNPNPPCYGSQRALIVRQIHWTVAMRNCLGVSSRVQKTDPAQWGNQRHWDKQPHEGAKTFWDVGRS